MKKILFIAYSFPPNSTSGIYRIMHFANELAKKKRFKPYVLTVKPEFYENNVHMDTSLLHDIHKDVEVYRTKNVHLRQWLVTSFGSTKNRKEKSGREKKSPFNEQTKSTTTEQIKKSVWQSMKDIVTDRILSFPDQFSGWLPFAVKEGVRIVKKENIDVIFATGAPWTSLVAGSLIKHITGKPLILDYRDPWIGNPFHRSRSTPLYTRLSERLEHLIVHKANTVILNTERLRENFIIRYPQKTDFYTLHNGYQESDIALSGTNPLTAFNTDFIFIHAGNLYGERSIRQFMIAFKTVLEKGKFQSKQLKLVLLSADENTSAVCRSILGKERMQKYCILSGRVPHSECIRQMESASCLLLFQQNTNLQVPRKLFEYLALKKPILAITPEDGETARLTQLSEGMVVDDDADMIASAIIRIVENYTDISQRLSDNHEYKQYETKNLTRKLEKIIQQTLSALSS